MESSLGFHLRRKTVKKINQRARFLRCPYPPVILNEALRKTKPYKTDRREVKSLP
jgi:hypothetical protein